MLIPCYLFFDNTLSTEWNIAETLKIKPISPNDLIDFFSLTVEFENQLPQKVCPIPRAAKENYYMPQSFWDEFLARESIHSLRVAIIPYYKIECNDLNLVKKLLFAFRLVCNGFIFAPLGLERKKPNTHDLKTFNTHYIYPLFQPVNSIYPSMRISEKQKSQVEECYKSLCNYDNEVIIGRANIAMDDNFPESLRFVEAISIIEIILCDGKKDKLTHSFINSLHLVTKESSEIETLSKTKARELYDIRSKLVHEGKHKLFNNNSEYLEKAIMLMKYILRQKLDGNPLIFLTHRKISFYNLKKIIKGNNSKNAVYNPRKSSFVAKLLLNAVPTPAKSDH